MSGSNENLKNLVESCYKRMDAEIKAWKSSGKGPLTLAEKIFLSLESGESLVKKKRTEEKLLSN